jgi:hypothetical protein
VDVAVLTNTRYYNTALLSHLFLSVLLGPSRFFSVYIFFFSSLPSSSSSFCGLVFVCILRHSSLSVSRSFSCAYYYCIVRGGGGGEEKKKTSSNDIHHHQPAPFVASPKYYWQKTFFSLLLRLFSICHHHHLH